MMDPPNQEANVRIVKERTVTSHLATGEMKSQATLQRSFSGSPIRYEYPMRIGVDMQPCFVQHIGCVLMVVCRRL
jgi:hypothetical protein